MWRRRTLPLTVTALRLKGQPLWRPLQRIVTFAPWPVRTLSTSMRTPFVVVMPLMRTSGKGFSSFGETGSFALGGGDDGEVNGAGSGRLVTVKVVETVVLAPSLSVT